MQKIAPKPVRQIARPAPRPVARPVQEKKGCGCGKTRIVEAIRINNPVPPRPRNLKRKQSRILM